MNELNLTIDQFQKDVEAFQYQTKVFDEKNSSVLSHSQQVERNDLINGLKESQNALKSNIADKVKLQAPNNSVTT